MKAKTKISTKAKTKDSTKAKDSIKPKAVAVVKEKVKAKVKPKEKAGKKTKVEIKWLALPEDHNYPASLAYLRLIYKDDVSEKIVADLRVAPVSHFKAKDIFRASRLSLLGISNSHVKKDRNKIKNGVNLSPILLVRDANNGKVVIADGYHRLCAVYSFSEDLFIPCQIV